MEQNSNSIGRSFQNTKLKPYGFFADWEVAPYYPFLFECRNY